MTRAITGIHDSSDNIRNAREDLIATGIDQQKLFVDAAQAEQLKVMVSARRNENYGDPQTAPAGFAGKSLSR